MRSSCSVGKRIKSQIQLMADIYHVFSTESSFASAAGWVFGCRMHQLLGAGRGIEMYPVRGHVATTNVIYSDYAATQNQDDALHFRLVKSGENFLPDPQTALLEKNVYYRPKFKNFPGINLWFFTKTAKNTHHPDISNHEQSTM